MTVEEILGFLADHLVRYKIPRSVEFTDRPLRDDRGRCTAASRATPSSKG
ncbi:hypothetical protein [Amycolatopsis sp. NPDC051128]